MIVQLENWRSTKNQNCFFLPSGRLEIALGAWAMADEAVTHYTALIEEHTRGFKFLENNFGACARPRIGWQVDPFGHSKEVAALFAQVKPSSYYSLSIINHQQFLSIFFIKQFNRSNNIENRSTHITSNIIRWGAETFLVRSRSIKHTGFSTCQQLNTLNTSFIKII